MKGFNLLKKCVPGIEKLNRPDILMSAVNYIKQLENKVKELEKESLKESTQLTDCETGMERDSEGKQDCTHSAPREPLMPEITGFSSPMETDLVTGLSSLMAEYSDISEPNSPTGQMVTDISEPEMAEESFTPVKTFASTTMETGASDEKSSRETSCAIDDHSATLKFLRHKILGTPTGASDEESSRETSSPMDATVPSTSEEIPQWVIVSPKEEELPEFNSVEDLRQWLGL
jgi:hypothetical protein